MAAIDEWVAAGRPWTKAQPIADVGACLEHYGFTVYYLGDMSHLTADPPEDHVPWSASGWPGKSPRWWVFAQDIMPPPPGRGLPSLAQLGAQIFADKQAGHPGTTWIKYMNWTDSNGDCWHDSWQPTHERVGSDDTGHIHISARTDFRTRRSAATYDPVARARGETMALSETDADALKWRVEALIQNRPTVAGGPTKGEKNVLHDALGATLALSPDDRAAIVADLIAAVGPALGAACEAAVRAVAADAATP